MFGFFEMWWFKCVLKLFFFFLFGLIVGREIIGSVFFEFLNGYSGDVENFFEYDEIVENCFEEVMVKKEIIFNV